MSVSTLPIDLKLEESIPVQLYDYHTNKEIFRSKVNLTHNTFSFLQQGVKEVITDKELVRIDNSDFLIIKSGNCLMTETISAARHSYHSLLLFFTDAMLIDFLERYKIDIHTPPQEHQSYLVCAYDHYITHFVQSLKHINQLQRDQQQALLKIKLDEILFYLVQQKGEEFLKQLLDKQDDKSSKLSSVVEHNKLQKLSLQELAFLCNMSVSTFKRAFKQQYEESPIKWFQDKRLEHAALTLSLLKKRPIEIYEAAGYENFSNFVQAFKKKYGLTPKQYQTQKMSF